MFCTPIYFPISTVIFVTTELVINLRQQSSTENPTKVYSRMNKWKSISERKKHIFACALKRTNTDTNSVTKIPINKNDQLEK